MRNLLAGAAAVACLIGVAAAGTAAQDRADPNAEGAARLATAGEGTEQSEYGGLFVATGVEETYYACTACHSEKIVAQQGLSRAHWDELFDWMVEEQGMSELEPDERQIILDYLATHYNEDRPNFPKRGP